MIRKLIALAALLGVVIAVTASSPAEATHSLDNSVANVNGGVGLDPDGDGKADADGDFDGDVACNLDGTNPAGDNDDPDIPGCDDDPDELCTAADGQTGDRAAFTDVVISGVFTGGTGGIGGFQGDVNVSTVNVCVVSDVTTHDLNNDNDPDNDLNGNGTNDVFDPDGDGNGDIPPIPVTAHGSLQAASFTTIGVGRSVLNPTAGACLFGNLVNGGTFQNTGALTSRAIIQANWAVRQPVAGACADPGTLIAQTGANVTLEADVAVVPAGLLTGGNLPDVVSAQVHSVHT